MNQQFIEISVLENLKQEFSTAKNILIFPHINADSDALGSAIALQRGLSQIGKTALVASCDEIVPRFFEKYQDCIVKEFQIENFDLVILVDHSHISRTGFEKIYPKIEEKINNLIIIDHHATSIPSEKIKKVIYASNETAPATAMIVLQIIEYLEIPTSQDISTCLLAGIYTDTGSFQHPNSNSDSFTMASQLAQSSHPDSVENIKTKLFQNHNSNDLKLLGRILANTKKTKRGVVVSAVTRQDFEETNTTPDSLEGAIDYLASIPDTPFVALVSERDDELLKISLRTIQDNIDVSKISQIFGGGGHKKAAGFTVRGKLEKTIKWEVK